MTLLSIVLSLLPGFAWLFFYLEEDLHPEPKRLILFTFIAGAASAILVLPVEYGLNNILVPIGITLFSPVSILLLALAEEIFKFSAAFFSIHKNPAFDEPVDAMIYMVVAALGFATVENLGAIYGGAPSGTAIVSTVFQLSSLRFIGATLLHALAAGIIGYYWAIDIREFGRSRFLFLGIGLATGLHAVFNYLIINYGNVVYAAVLLLIIGFLVLNDFEKLKRKTI